MIPGAGLARKEGKRGQPVATAAVFTIDVVDRMLTWGSGASRFAAVAAAVANQ